MSLILISHFMLSPFFLILEEINPDSRIGVEKAMAPTLVLLPGKSHGQGSLVGCSPWGQEESDTTEQLHFHFSLSCTGEGNGNPLQCSCLENPRDGGAWWAAIIYGVTQSWTRLKRVSSSMLKVFYQISHSRIHSSDLQQPWKVQTVSLRLSVLGLCNLKNY